MYASLLFPLLRLHVLSCKEGDSGALLPDEEGEGPLTVEDHGRTDCGHAEDGTGGGGRRSTHLVHLHHGLLHHVRHHQTGRVLGDAGEVGGLKGNESSFLTKKASKNIRQRTHRK